MNDTDHKSVCDTCYMKTWYDTEQPCKRDFGGNKCTGTLRVIDNKDLNPRAKRFYESGERVEITYKDGEKTRCYIGKSTGWKPVYLEVLRRNSSGGGALYLPDDAQIRGLGIYR